MTMNSKSFVELDRSYSSVVKLGDGKLKKVEGKEPLLSTQMEVTENLFMMCFMCQVCLKTSLVLVNYFEKATLYYLMMVNALYMIRNIN